MVKVSQYELEREANIARNKAFLEQLQLKQAVEELTEGLPPSAKQRAAAEAEVKAKQAKKPRDPRKKTETPVDAPRRQSRRLQGASADPTTKRKRVAEEEEEAAKAAEDALEQEYLNHVTKRARHEDFSLSGSAPAAFEGDTPLPVGRAIHSGEAETREIEDLQNRLRDMDLVARNQVGKARIYSSTYHRDASKDLIFFGDKAGQVAVWDVRAPTDEVDDDGDVTPKDGENELGKVYQMQIHWPAKDTSSVSCVKVDPANANVIYTTAYDCTVRRTSLTDQASTELYSLEDTLLSSLDPLPNGELWVSDNDGGITHLDQREEQKKAIRYQLSDKKIGCVSLNPVYTNYLSVSSNSRSLKIWDSRCLRGALDQVPEDMKAEKDTSSYPTTVVDSDVISNYLDSDDGKSALRAEWKHGKSVSSGYWAPDGRKLVTTSYDDTVRLWDFREDVLTGSAPFPSARPLTSVKHNVQTGRFVSILKAQWSMNPEVYPHFTIANMKPYTILVYSAKGDLLAELGPSQYNKRVQAVTCSHPRIVERAAGGGADGKVFLWGPKNFWDEA
ncbi:WD40-repeat-containing domain protein [Flagelloscypha sp. PMI_526]|nr:WD40-repeat-containing domain protein [Flagelloscypha sp. PMI_526]